MSAIGTLLSEIQRELGGLSSVVAQLQRELEVACSERDAFRARLDALETAEQARELEAARAEGALLAEQQHAEQAAKWRARALSAAKVVGYLGLAWLGSHSPEVAAALAKALGL